MRIYGKGWARMDTKGTKGKPGIKNKAQPLVIDCDSIEMQRLYMGCTSFSCLTFPPYESGSFCTTISALISESIWRFVAFAEAGVCLSCIAYCIRSASPLPSAGECTGCFKR